MASLQGHTVKLTYKDILQVSNSNSGVDSSLRAVSDGEGTATPLELSTTEIRLNGQLWPSSLGNEAQVLTTHSDGTLYFADPSAGGASGLNDLTDVTIAGVASSNVLQYDGAAWVNLSLASAGISAVGHTHTTANITDIATAAVAFTNKTGNVSQWTNDSGYATATSATAFTNKTGAISQWTNDSGYLTTNTALCFKTIAVSGQNDVVADSITDTLTLVAGSNITITTDDTTDTITIAASGGGPGGTPTDITVANEGTDTTCFPSFFTASTGDLGPKTNASLTFNSNTATLASTTFSGALTGNVTGDVSGSSGSCTGNSATVTVANEAADSTCFIGFLTAASGSLPLKTNTGLTYDATTSILTATGFSGPLTGNVTGNVSGSSGSCTGNSATSSSTTGNAATVTTNANLTGPITSAGNATSIASQTGTGTKFVVDNTPTLITPVLGVATATSINKLTLTQPATGSTLTIQDGFTLTASGNATVSGTHTGASSGTNTGDQTTVSGNAGTATALATPRAIGGTNFDGTAAITPNNITAANDVTNATYYPAYFSSATGAVQPKTNVGYTVNPSTNTLTASTFVGALTGNVTGNTSGSSGSCTGNSATVTTNANLTGQVTSSGNAALLDKTAITGQTVDASPDPAADYILTYDASATSLKKVLMSSLPAGSPGNLTGEVTSTGLAAVWDKTAITNRTQDTAPDHSADYIATYDASATALKKVLSTDLKKWTPVTSATASTSASIIFTGLTAYNEYMFQFETLLPSTTSDFWNAEFSIDNGSTYLASGLYGGTISTSTNKAMYNVGVLNMTSTATVVVTAGRELFGFLTLNRADNANAYNKFEWLTAYRSSVPTDTFGIGTGLSTSGSDIDAVKFTMSAGNIASGTVRVYGR